MNRLRAFAIILSVIVFLSGCQSDDRQTAKIQKIIEESTSFENHFTENLSDLFTMKKTAQSVYIELIDLNINDTDSIRQKIKKAQTYTKEQQSLKVEAEENFQKAYQNAITIEKPIKKLKNKDQKNKAEKLFNILNERQKIMDSFFKDYHHLLDLQHTFYQHLANENFHLENLNDLIQQINERNQNMNEYIQQFNQYTKQYIEAEKDFEKIE